MLRDVREGAVAPQAASPAPRRATVPLSAPTAGMSRGQELTALVIGNAVVIVPAAAIIAFGLWTGYESVAGTGVSVVEAILLSVGSLALTVGLAFVWASRRQGRH